MRHSAFAGTIAILLLSVIARPAHAETFIVDARTSIVGDVRVIAAREQDTLIDLASQFDLGFDQIVLANPDVDPWLPGNGTAVVLPTRFILPSVPRVGIVLNLAAMRLFYFMPRAATGTTTVITYPVAIGRDDWRTPRGLTTVIAKDLDPVWQVPPAIRDEHARDDDPLPEVIPPGASNPLGKHALRLGFDGYLIHGTNRPFGIGMRLTHGCIRLYAADIAALFPLVQVGTPVQIIDARYLAAWHHGVLYVEAHARANTDEDRAMLVHAVLAAPGHGRALTKTEWDAVSKVAAEPRGIPWPVTVEDPQLLR